MTIDPGPTATATAAPNPVKASGFYPGVYLISYINGATATARCDSGQAAANLRWQIMGTLRDARDGIYPSGASGNVPKGFRLMSVLGPQGGSASAG